MAITSISRDWGQSPAIVRITSSDALLTVEGASYLADQAANISALNSGPFDWEAGDNALVQASDGSALYQINAALDGLNPSGVSPLLLKYVEVDITAAEINGMYVAPKELVAAPGAGRLLVLEGCRLLLDYGSAAFASGGVSHVQYDSTTLGAGIIASSTNLAASLQLTADNMFTYNAGVVVQPLATCVNKSLSLSNITGAFTTGTGSVLVAHVWYRDVPSS